jgi:hypothetical protein
MTEYLEYSQAGGFKDSNYKLPVDLDDCEESLKQSGWQNMLGSGGGDSDIRQLMSYSYKGSQPSEFTHLVTVWNGCEEEASILTRGKADWLALRVALTPLVTGPQTAFHSEGLNELAEKVFQIWHGHSRYAVCMECDPEETTKLRESRISRNKKTGS